MQRCLMDRDASSHETPGNAAGKQVEGLDSCFRTSDGQPPRGRSAQIAKRFLRSGLAACATLTLSAIFAGCGLVGPDDPGSGSGNAGGLGAPRAVGITPIGDEAAVRAYLAELAAGRNDRGGLLTADFGLGAPEAFDATAGATGGDEGATVVSTTNTQVAGVDEADVFKTDGDHLYISRGRSVRVLDAELASGLPEIGEIEFPGVVREMYLRERQLIVLSEEFRFGTPHDVEIAIWPPLHYGVEVYVTQVDMSDPAAPAVVAEQMLEGNIASSRLVDDRLILVLTMLPKSQDEDAATEAVLPVAESNGAQRLLVSPEDWYRPLDPFGSQMSAVVSLDANDVTNSFGSVALMADVQTVYASTESVYLAGTDYLADDGLRTDVYKVAFDESGAPEFVATGVVPGYLLNQFALDEFDGNLRVASHLNGFVVFPFVEVNEDDSSVSVSVEFREPSNAVYVLSETDGMLEIVGRVEDLAPGERLYSARFLGDRGYLVTFEQVDPLFTLDLSDPAVPTVLGELKIPGYSDYLHPIAGDRLIGVGRSTVEGRWGGVLPDALQVSLFDVSDPMNPIALSQQTFGGFGSASEVSQTHKAFTFIPEQNLLLLPSLLWANRDLAGRVVGDEEDFSGVLVLDVTETGFNERMRVAHALGEFIPWQRWLRGALIDDAIYAVSPNGVRGTSLIEPGLDVVTILQGDHD